MCWLAVAFSARFQQAEELKTIRGSKNKLKEGFRSGNAVWGGVRRNENCSAGLYKVVFSQCPVRIGMKAYGSHIGCLIVHIFSVKLVHHELAAGFVTQEQSSISGERANHGGGKPGVKCPHTYTHTN